MANWHVAFSILVLFLCSSTSAFSSSSSETNASKQQQSNSDAQLPNGYYVFAKAPNAVPPKIRKPPYLPITAECPGTFDSNTLISKNNLCGDLNRGFIPRNPMNQNLYGQPYPFDLIKNKTLQYLSKTLPYLKEEIESIPKVARFVKPSDFFKNHLKRFARQAANYSEPSTIVSTINSTTSPSVVPNVTNVGGAGGGGGGGGGGKETNNQTNKLSRQNICEGNVICQTLESLKEDGPFSKTFLNNVMSAVGNVASISSVVSLLDQYNNNQQAAGLFSNGTTAGGVNKLSQLSQLLSSVSSISEHNNSGSPPTGTTLEQQAGSSYSPLLTIIDYLQSNLQTPKYAAAAKRKSEPLEQQDYLAEGPEKSQTPCMSTEEYISPTFARNYQGVWKYVVQIPNEGYFTQTVQQTTCIKSKCDLIEGSCRESPRWVSLLVAEIFYPNVYFPVNQMMLYKQQLQQVQSQQQPQPQDQPGQGQYQVLSSQHKPYGGSPSQTINKRVTQSSQLSTTANQLNGIDLSVLANILKRNEQPTGQNVELLARRARTVPGKDGSTSVVNTEPSNTDSDETIGQEKRHCDGYDKVGCYVVRVYYDWFLVNGSCKCWKSASSGLNINETIKRIFIGKWKKK